MTTAKIDIHTRKPPLAIQADRIVVWVLLVGFIAFMLTGYALTRGWMNHAQASFLHLEVCPILVGLAFAYHSAYSIHLVLRRNRSWNRVGKALTGIYSLVVTLGILVLTQATGAMVGPATAQAAARPPTSTPPGQEEVKAGRFTAGQLANYNGTGGQPAYVAIDGKVYDVSRLYRAGVHFGCIAGRNVSQEFAQIHPVRILALFPQVGSFVGH